MIEKITDLIKGNQLELAYTLIHSQGVNPSEVKTSLEELDPKEQYNIAKVVDSLKDKIEQRYIKFLTDNQEYESRYKCRLGYIISKGVMFYLGKHNDICVDSFTKKKSFSSTENTQRDIEPLKKLITTYESINPKEFIDTLDEKTSVGELKKTYEFYTSMGFTVNEKFFIGFSHVNRTSTKTIATQLVPIKTMSNPCGEIFHHLEYFVSKINLSDDE